MEGDLTVYVGEAAGVIPYRHPAVTRELTLDERDQLASDLAFLWAKARKLSRAELLELLRPYARPVAGAVGFADRAIKEPEMGTNEELLRRLVR